MFSVIYIESLGWLQEGSAILCDSFRWLECLLILVCCIYLEEYIQPCLEFDEFSSFFAFCVDLWQNHILVMNFFFLTAFYVLYEFPLEAIREPMPSLIFVNGTPSALTPSPSLTQH